MQKDNISVFVAAGIPVSILAYAQSAAGDDTNKLLVTSSIWSCMLHYVRDASGLPVPVTSQMMKEWGWCSTNQKEQSHLPGQAPRPELVEESLPRRH